jgi:pimeloyl-ACP methyl ester carboxylesterase
VTTSTARIVDSRIEFTARDGVPLALHRVHRDDVDAYEAPAVVLCHGFVQNRLAFEAGSVSLVEHLCQRGYVVYRAELRGRLTASSAHGLSEYVVHDAPAILDVVIGGEPARAVTWIGHSMGGLIGACVQPTQPLAGLVCIGTPLLPGDARLHVRRINELMVLGARLLAKRGVPFSGRRYGRLLHALRALFNVPGASLPFRIWHPRSLDDEALKFALHESFADDSFAVLADLIELIVTDGEWAGGVPVGERLRALHTPLLVLAGDNDGLAPAASARMLFQRAASVDKRFVEFSRESTGHSFSHIDMLIGARAPDVVWPVITGFLTAHMRGR